MKIIPFILGFVKTHQLDWGWPCMDNWMKRKRSSVSYRAIQGLAINFIFMLPERAGDFLLPAVLTHCKGSALDFAHYIYPELG